MGMIAALKSLSVRAAPLLTTALVTFSASVSQVWAEDATALNNPSIILSQLADGPNVSCVEPGSTYHLKTAAGSLEGQRCINANGGFTTGVANETNACFDSTKANSSGSTEFLIRTDEVLSTDGIAGTVALSETLSEPTPFSYPTCDTRATCTPLPSGARAWWRFNESSGTTAIDTIASRNGTLINGPIRTTGIVSRALDFDGVNDYISVPDYSALDFGTSDFSIEAWIRTSDTGTNTIVSKRVYSNGKYIGFVFMVYNGHLLLQIGDSTNSYYNYVNFNVAAVNNLQWRHVAVTVDRNSTTGGRFYLDGNVIFTFNPTGRQGNISNAGILTIGRTSDSTDYFDGQIDEVAMYARALSSSEIQSIYNAGSAGKCSPAPTPVSAQLFCLEEEGGLSAPSTATSSITPSIIIPGGVQVTCAASATGGTGGYSYTWQYNGSGNFFPSGPSATIFNCTGPGTVTVNVTDGSSTDSASWFLSCSL